MTDRNSEDFYSASEAAMVLGVSKRSILNWLNDGTLEGNQDPETGHWSIPEAHVRGLLAERRQKRVPRPEKGDTPSRELVGSLQDQIGYLRRELEQAHDRDRENRRFIAALTSRIPELPAPQEQSAPSDERESPESATASESKAPSESGAEPQTGAQRRSWWREFFGI